jgi:transposase
VKDFCRSQRKYRSISALYRFETEPGRQAQVDFDDFGYVEID